jgi:hypothetical protein
MNERSTPSVLRLRRSLESGQTFGNQFDDTRSKNTELPSYKYSRSGNNIAHLVGPFPLR